MFTPAGQATPKKTCRDGWLAFHRYTSNKHLGIAYLGSQAATTESWLALPPKVCGLVVFHGFSCSERDDSKNLASEVSAWTEPLEGMRVVSRIGGRKQLEVQTVAEDQFNVRSLAAAVVWGPKAD